MDAYESLLALKGRNFDVVLADPAWSYDAKGSRMAPDCKDKFRYPTMSVEEIMALPVKDVVADNASLVLWATDSFLDPAFDIVKAWGFRYIQTLLWCKVTKGGEPHMGGGSYFRHTHELALFGIRGKVNVLRHDMDANLYAQRRQHSKKPEEMYEKLEATLPGTNRLEMFATSQRQGWFAWGNGIYGNGGVNWQTP